MNEVWVDIPAANVYKISNMGLVKSMNYKCTGKERILKPLKMKNGYLYVSLRIDGKTVTKSIHRLVWEAFNGPIPEGMQVNHINEDRTDNRLENLNLLTNKENCNWGTHNEKLSIPVVQYDLEGNVVENWVSAREVEKVLGFNHAHIGECCRGERLTANNFKWSYRYI